MSAKVVDLCSSGDDTAAGDDVVDLCSSGDDTVASDDVSDDVSAARASFASKSSGMNDSKSSAGSKAKVESKPLKLSRREQNWHDTRKRIERLLDKDGASAVKSGSSEYTWLYGMKNQLEAYDKDPANFVSQKSSRAFTEDKVDLVRPLVNKWMNRKKSPRRDSRSRDSSTSNNRSRSRSRNGRDSRGRSHSHDRSKVNWENVKLSWYRVKANTVCINPDNQDLFEQICDMAEYRLSVVGFCRENVAHFFTGAKLYRIAKCLSKVR